MVVAKAASCRVRFAHFGYIIIFKYLTFKKFNWIQNPFTRNFKTAFVTERKGRGRGVGGGGRGYTGGIKDNGKNSNKK